MSAQKYAMPEQQNLKAIVIFYPQSNGHDAALLDEDTGLVIGFSDDRPYHPAGKSQATREIVGSGLVPGSEVYGFECYHLYDNLYRLGKREAA